MYEHLSVTKAAMADLSEKFTFWSMCSNCPAYEDVGVPFSLSVYIRVLYSSIAHGTQIHISQLTARQELTLNAREMTSGNRR